MPNTYLLAEDGTYILQETDFRIILEIGLDTALETEQDSGFVLKLHYGADKRNPTRTLDLSEDTATGNIFMNSGGFTPGPGQMNVLWSGQSIRFDGQKRVASSRDNARVTFTYNLRGDTTTHVGWIQRQINRFFLEASLYEEGAQGEPVWLEYRWYDGLKSLPAPTFGQFSQYYRVLWADVPKWPDDLHNNNTLITGNVTGVVMELTCAPYAEGLRQKVGNATGLADVDADVDLKWVLTTEMENDFTVAGWTEHASNDYTFFEYYIDASNYVRVHYEHASTRIQVKEVEGGATTSTNWSVSGLTAGTAVHIVCVNDEGSSLTLYVNGVSRITTGGFTSSAAGTLQLGGSVSAAAATCYTTTLDGWRVWSTTLTSIQADVLYDNELPIKTAGGWIGKPPYLKTRLGAGVFENVDDSTRDNWGVIGNVVGDDKAMLELQLVPSTVTNNLQWIGIKYSDEAFAPSSYLFFETDVSGTADATASAGSYGEATGSTLNLDSTLSTALKKKILFNRYKVLARINTGDVVTVTPKYGFGAISESVQLISGTALTGFNSVGQWILQDLGDIFLRHSGETSTTELTMRITMEALSSITVKHDFTFLLPYPSAKIYTTETLNLTTTRPLIVKEGEAYCDMGGAVLKHLEHGGPPLRVAPNKYNYLFLTTIAISAAHSISHTTTTTAYITPRWTTPGGPAA